MMTPQALAAIQTLLEQVHRIMLNNDVISAGEFRFQGTTCSRINVVHIIKLLGHERPPPKITTRTTWP
jgi:hypothetical protein